MVNKRGEMNYENLQKGDVISFMYVGMVGEHEGEGVVMGFAEDAKKAWPGEFDGMTGDENCYLVRRKDNFGNTFHHVVWPEEILGCRNNIYEKEEK